MASDLICSIAPLAASGLDEWGAGYGDQCFTAGGPPTPRSVFYTSGEADQLATVRAAQPGPGPRLSGFSVSLQKSIL